MLHYAGHGLPNWLVFEDGQGSSHLLDSQELNKLFAAGNSCKRVQLVFVAACHSEASGNAFIGAGVKHVIAVRVNEKLQDKSAVTFTKQFYLVFFLFLNFEISVKSSVYVIFRIQLYYRLYLSIDIQSKKHSRSPDKQ